MHRNEVPPILWDSIERWCDYEANSFYGTQSSFWSSLGLGL